VKPLAAALILLVAASAPGCYRIAGRPYENVQTVGVKVFTNKTLYSGVDFQLTDAVRRELSATTVYAVASPAKADAVIEGDLTEYSEPAEVVDEQQNVVARRLFAAASYRLVDNSSGEVLAGPASARWSELYRMRTGRTLAEVREDLFRKLAQRIVQQVFLPWPDDGALEPEDQQE